MSTPFEFFRRNQKVALAAVTGMAILSFLVQDAVSNSGEMSPMGVGVLLIGSLAIVGWVWGAKTGKSGDNAMMGAIVGLALTVAFMFLGRPPAAMSATSGNLSAADLQQRIFEQDIANRMINLVYYRADSFRSMMEQFRPGSARPQLFQYLGDDKNDAIISELLNREADELGIEITDDAVMNHLKEVAGKDKDGEENLTRQLFDDAIRDTSGAQGRVTEEQIFDALRHELRARQAANLLLGGSRLTPADVWDLHRKLSVRQTAQVVGIPVNDFVKKDSQPSDSDAQELFEKYKNNYPNTTPPPQKLEEGRPGFYLPRRMRIAYVEPNYEEFEKQIGEITEEEILKRYEEQYKKEMPVPTGDGMSLDMPVLPSVPQSAPAGDKPAAPADGETPATPPAPPASEPSADKPAESAKPADAPADSSKPTEPAAEPAKPAEEKPTEEKPAEPAKPEGSSQLRRASKFQTVALIQETGADKPAEAPAVEAPKADAPAATTEKSAEPAAEAKPAAPAEAQPEAPKPADAPAAEKPADKPATEETPPPSGDKPATPPLTVPPVDTPAVDDDPAPPVSKVRPLDDALKQQIREELRNEKLQPLLTARTEAARDYMNELQLRVADYLDHEKALKNKKKSELAPDAISPEAASEELKRYAKEHGLTYTETPLLSLDELSDSEDYPIRGAMVRDRPVNMVLDGSPITERFSANAAVRFGENLATYAFWKIDDVAQHAPVSMDEPGVKDAVVKAWRQLEARPMAEKRAQALAEIVAKSDKPMAEALAEQTVTGDPQSLFVTVNTTSEFSWMQRRMVPSQFGMDEGPPQLGAVNGVDRAGAKFMAKVFDEMKPGDTAVVPNENLSVYYIVKVEKRTPSTESELESMKNSFLSSAAGSGNLSGYAAQMSMAQDGNFLDRLYTKHGVKIPNEESEDQIEN